jgi:hypothetical protein
MKRMVEGSNAPAMASIVNMFEETMGIQGEITEVEGERVAKMIASCPLSKCPPEVCQLIECYARGVANIVAPEFTFKQEATMTKGDSQCHWEVRRK